MNYLAELFEQVAGSLLRNKLRSFLTMAGIAWGIASIVLIVAMGDSFKEGRKNDMKGLGDNIVIVFGGRTEMQEGGQRAGRRIRLNYDDVESMRREGWQLQSVAAEIEANVRATSPFNSGSFEVSGVEAHFPDMRTIPIGSGRFFTAKENTDGERVCIIGVDVKKQLFGVRTGVVGSQIFINSLPYRVIGVMADKTQNSSYSGRDETKIWMPYTSMTRDVPPKKSYEPGYLDEIIYQPRSLDDFKAAQTQVRKILGRNHHFAPTDLGAIHMWDTVEDQQMVAGIFNSMTLFLGFIGFVTLSLGGVGVMNIMLVTVSERTREIGLRKALGATRLRIMGDFLAEGAVLAFVSGFAGWAFTFGLSRLLTLFPMPEQFPGLPVSWTTTWMAFLTLGIIAVGSAFVPAWQASALTPVEALRDER